MNLLLSISIGAVIGALGRHYISSAVSALVAHQFPLGTIFVNVIGSFIMGVFIECFALRWTVSQEIQALLTVGMLGSFTTFSTFSLDFALLLKRGEYFPAFCYFSASTILSIGALFLGLYLAKLGNPIARL